MKRVIHIVLFICSPLICFCQFMVKGQVRDESGNALLNAALFVHSDSYTYYSRSEGLFGIALARRFDTITVSLEGFVKRDIPVDAQGYADIVLKKAPITRNSRTSRLSSIVKDLKRETQQQWFTGDETYASLIENQFINATAYPAAGLTLNVDRASYSNIRRFLTMNTPVPPDAVRLEEMLNYFNLSYQEPPDKKNFQISTTLTDCPWNPDNQLLFARVTSKKIQLDSLPQSNLVFLIDVSGSMDMPNRLPLLKAGFKALVNNLRAVDSVSIIVYGGTVGVALPTTGGDKKEEILKTIDSLQAGGSTPGESGIKLAYSFARNHFIKKGNNRIILATDGDFNVGLQTDKELEEMITVQRESGIYLTCVGVGMGNYKDSKIQTLAQRGNGNFAYIDNYAEAEKVLLKEFSQTLFTVADDAYLTVQFNPDFVKEYRLLGFDNKVGAIKDKDATIDGGEIGSAYSSLIAFEIIPTKQAAISADNGNFTAPAEFNLQYQLPGTDKQYDLKYNAELNFTQFAKLSKDYQFASAVLMFGSFLRKSKQAKEISLNEIIQIASASLDNTNYSQKEFVLLVQHAKTIYGKKKKR